MVGIIDRLKRDERINWIEKTDTRIIVEIYGLVDLMSWEFSLFFLFCGIFPLCVPWVEDEFTPYKSLIQALFLGPSILFFLMLIRKHMKCVILVGDGSTKRLYALEESIGSRRRMKIATDFANVRSLDIKHRRATKHADSSDRLYIKFYHGRGFNAGRTSGENIGEIKQAFLRLMRGAGEQFYPKGGIVS